MSITADEFDDGFDDQDEGGLSGFYVLAIFLIILGAFAVIVYFAYQKGLATTLASDDALPVVAADPSPVREEVPLAMRDERRQEVYDRLEGVTPTAVIAEVDQERDPLDGFAQAAPAAVPASAENAAPEPTSRPGPPDAALAPVAASEPVRTAAAVPTPEPAPIPQPDPVPSAGPATHVVQVGAFGSNDEALGFYRTLSDRHGSLVATRSPDVQSAEVKGTTYHRLRLGPFTSKDDAAGYCADLKEVGQDCFVKAI